MDLKDVPGRVFLDTCVVNFILDHAAEIHDNVATAESIDVRSAEDVDALSNLFLTGQRAQWQLAVSPYTYSEIARTRNPSRLSVLDGWFQELWQYWRSIVELGNDLPSFIQAEEMRVPTAHVGVSRRSARRGRSGSDLRRIRVSVRSLLHSRLDHDPETPCRTPTTPVWYRHASRVVGPHQTVRGALGLNTINRPTTRCTRPAQAVP